MENDKTCFVFISGENYAEVKRFKDFTTAQRYMKRDYKNYEFDPNDYGGDGSCNISTNSAYVDSPDDSWQRTWLILSMDELANLPIKKR